MADTGHRTAEQFAYQVSQLLSVHDDADVDRSGDEASFTVTTDTGQTTVSVMDVGDNFHVEIIRETRLLGEVRHEDGATVRTVTDDTAAAVVSTFI
jgi:hypothetical protein